MKTTEDEMVKAMNDYLLELLANNAELLWPTDALEGEEEEDGDD